MPELHSNCTTLNQTAPLPAATAISCLISRTCVILCPLSQTETGASIIANTDKEITREKFSGFLAWLHPEPERAGEEYERLRFRLCTFFGLRQCAFADDLADETINRVIVKASTEKIENKLAYCYGVARNVYREWLREQRPHLDIDDVTIATGAPEEPSFSSECLDKCLEELPPETRTLLLSYFSDVKTAKIKLHQRISTSLKTSQTAVRMRVMRGKRKLKLCVQDCMA